MIIIADRANSSHSIDLVHIERRLFVRKSSVGADPRFDLAIQKQREFRPISLGNLSIRAASVTKVNATRDNGIELLMPYVHGICGDDFALFGSRDSAHDVARALNAVLIDEMSVSSIQSVSTSVFLEKINDVISSNKEPKCQGFLIECLAVLESLFSKISDVLMPVGSCHGDLTLSNLILSPSNTLYLIDFLPTFLESPLQDAAKIKQDLYYGWSFRRLDRPLQVKGSIFGRCAVPSYLSHLDKLFPKPSLALELLCLARIAPYIRDDATLNWLLDSLPRCLSRFDSFN